MPFKSSRIVLSVMSYRVLFNRMENGRPDQTWNRAVYENREPLWSCVCGHNCKILCDLVWVDINRRLSGIRIMVAALSEESKEVKSTSRCCSTSRRFVSSNENSACSVYYHSQKIRNEKFQIYYSWFFQIVKLTLSARLKEFATSLSWNMVCEVGSQS